MKGKFKPDIWKFCTIVILLLYAVFLLFPLVNLLKQSVIDANGAFTLKYFIKFFTTKYYVVTLFNSLKVTLSITVFSLLIGASLAYLFVMYQVRGKTFIQILIILSSLSAPFIGAYSWILLLGRNGIITDMLKNIGITDINIYGFVGITLVLTMQMYPLVFLYTSGALKNIDFSLMEASEGMGCTGAKRFAKVVIPLIMPTILASGLLVFMRALADFGTPMLIGEGYRTFPVLIYSQYMSEVTGDDGFAAAISVIAIIITAIIFLIQKYASNRTAFAMNALHPIEAVPVKGLKSFFIHLFTYVTVGLSIMPQVFVIYTSFLKTDGLIFVKGYWLGSYRSAFSKLGSSIQNTFIISGISLAITILIAVLIAYLVVRRKNTATNAIDLTSMVAYIIPGSVIGIALVMCFNKPPIAIAGGIIIMVVAFTVRRLPYTIRSSVAILQQIPGSIEEAAISLGTSKLKTFFTITVPMMANGIISGAILSWVTMITELSTSIILYTEGTKTLTVSIYTEVIRGNYGVAAALSAVLTALTAVSLLIFMKISKTKDLTV